MSAPFLFSSGLFVVILFLIGLIYTFKEFSEMQRHPSDFRKDRTDEPEIIEKG